MKEKNKTVLSVLVLTIGFVAAIIEIFSFYDSRNGDSEDLSGKWDLTVRILESDKKEFEEGKLTINYILFLTVSNSSV